MRPFPVSCSVRSPVVPLDAVNFNVTIPFLMLLVSVMTALRPAICAVAVALLGAVPTLTRASSVGSLAAGFTVAVISVGLTILMFVTVTPLAGVAAAAACAVASLAVVATMAETAVVLLAVALVVVAVPLCAVMSRVDSGQEAVAWSLGMKLVPVMVAL